MYEPEILASLCNSDLKHLYVELFKTTPPTKSRRDFLLGNISWATQARTQYKGVELLRKKLVSQASNQTVATKTKYLVGTRIIREWKGITHEVIVQESGFRWQQQTYKSLSHIAREITGARWSGPRFFGLKNPKEAISE
ncbi:MAG: DUF2924 domain-containing protein [Cycloclasticus sp.]|nr:DUF2924 domain-containing protein [Cycloclasticus sp.]